MYCVSPFLSLLTVSCPRTIAGKLTAINWFNVWLVVSNRPSRRRCLNGGDRGKALGASRGEELAAGTDLGAVEEADSLVDSISTV